MALTQAPADSQATPATPESPETMARNHELEAQKRAKQILDERKGSVTPFTAAKLPYFGERPGWKRRWVLSENVPGRLQEGYSFVKNDQVEMQASGIGFGNQDIGDRVAVFAGRGSLDKHGGQQYLYLMEVPQEIADKLHDIKVVQPTQATIASLKAGDSGGFGTSDKHAYVPRQTGISIKQ